MNHKMVKAGDPDVIYQVTEQEALDLAQWAMAQTLPDQKIHRLKKPRVGYFVHEVDQPGHYRVARFKETTYIYELDLIRTQGGDSQGGQVAGYAYTVKGNGDLKAGPGKLAVLEQKLKEAFDQSGRAVAVSTARPVEAGPPKLSTEKPPVAASPAPSPSSSTTAKTPMVAPVVSPQEKPMVKEAPAPAAKAKASPDVDDDVFNKLKKLKDLLDQGIITQEEFQSKKKELLDRI